MQGDEPDYPQVAAGFHTAALANRRVAGVAAAARAAHRLADQGISEVRLVIEDGCTLDEAAWRDVRRLCADRQVTIFGPQQSPVPVIPEPIVTTREILLATGKASDGVISRLLNRPVSRSCSALLLKLPGIEPVHATLGTAAIAMIMFAVFLFGSGTSLIVGALLFHAASVFDGVDGEIARATFRVSAAGASLDSAVGIMTNLLFVLGLTISLTMRGGVMPALLGAWSLTLLAMGFWLIGLRHKREHEPLRFEWLKQHVQLRLAGRLMSRVAGLAIFLTTRDSIAFFFMVMTLAGLALPALCVLALAATIWIGVLIAALANARRDGAAMTGVQARPSGT